MGASGRRPSADIGTPWSRRNLGFLTLAVLIGIVLIAFWMRPKPAKVARAHDDTTSTDPAPDEPEPERAAQEPSGAPPVAAAAPPAASAEPAPVIDRVLIEKTSVCAGEENLVTIKAHTVNGTDEQLHYVVDNQMGSSVPLRLWRDDHGEITGQHTVTVFGRGNVSTTVPLPNYEVRDCRPTRMVAIDTRVRSNTWADFDIVAKVLTVPADRGSPDHPRAAPPPPPPFVPKSYVWSFGDGTTATTSTPNAEHDYEGRPQTALYSYFLIEVEAHGKDGEVAKGRSSLALINPAYEALSTKGIVSLMISLNPRFPELGSDGKVTQQVRIWHNDRAAVTIDRATRTIYYEKGSGQTSPEGVSPGAVLGTTTIPPGKDGITATVVLDVDTQPEVSAVTFELYGTSSAGNPVLGSFSVMQPPPKPNASNSQMIRDGMLKAKIIRARELLGKDTVSDEDLWQLEREGAFAQLPPAPVEPGPPPSPPKDMPARDPTVTAVKGPAVPINPNGSGAPGATGAGGPAGAATATGSKSGTATTGSGDTNSGTTTTTPDAPGDHK